MHGATLAAADAGLLSEQLRHDLARWDILAERMHVVAVGRADVVVPPEVPDHTRGDSLEACISVDGQISELQVAMRPTTRRKQVQRPPYMQCASLGLSSLFF